MTYLSAMDDVQTGLPRTRADEDTAFVLGNGPSLAGVSLPSLSPYATIGMNAAYRYWREIDWRPRYYACVDLVVGMSHKDEIAALIEEGRIERFLLRSNLVEALGRTAQTRRVVNFDAARESKPLLAENPPTTGSHSALWAASMGYKKIVILGVDAQYKEIVKGAKRGDGIELEIVEEADNPNYFFKGYQAPGDRYNIPNPRPDLHVNAWRRTAARLKETGVEIYNGNPGSGVRCLSFIDLERFLGAGDAPKTPDEALPDLRETKKSLKREFIAAHGAVMATAFLLLGIAVAAWAALAQVSLPLIALAAASALAVFGLGAALLYVRFAVLDHLQRQEASLTSLRARVADLERFSD